LAAVPHRFRAWSQPQSQKEEKRKGHGNVYDASRSAHDDASPRINQNPFG
jgi:hypothetical protein